MRIVRGALVLLVTCLAVIFGPRASAACHSFTVSTSSPVSEGNKVTVTVKRDNNFRPSSVQVRTVNGTALGGADYQPTITRVEFTNETVRTLQIATTEDNVHESDETFQIKLENAQGCEVNRNYQYGTPATVTVKDDDPGVPGTTPPKTPAPTAAPTGTAHTASPSPTTTATAKASKSPKPTSTPTGTPATAVAAPVEEDKGISPALAVIAIVAFGLAAAGAVLAARMRRASR
jgi:hypothetical protein